MSHVYRVPASEAFVFRPEMVILSPNLLRDGKRGKGIEPKIEDLTASCRSPLVEEGDVLEVEVELHAMPGAHKGR